MALSVALQLYSVGKDTAEDMHGTLQRVKDMGYDGVELAGLHGNDPSDVKKMCEDIGLIPISAHMAYPTLAKDPMGALSRYVKTGCKYAVIQFLGSEYRYGTDKFPIFIEDLKRIGAAARELGMTLLYHNHDFEFAKTQDGKYVLDFMYDEVGADLLQTEIDTCWVKVAGVDPVAYVKKYSGRAPIVHLKDFVGEKNHNEEENNFEYRPLGDGVQNIPDILKASEEAGALWVVVEQDEASMGLTPMQCAERSREYLKTLNY